MKERTCERCDGKEYHAMSALEHIHSWRPRQPLREYWFCARCDWGREPDGDDLVF